MIFVIFFFESNAILFLNRIQRLDPMDSAGSILLSISIRCNQVFDAHALTKKAEEKNNKTNNITKQHIMESGDECLCII